MLPISVVLIHALVNEIKVKKLLRLWIWKTIDLRLNELKQKPTITINGQ